MKSITYTLLLGSLIFMGCTFKTSFSTHAATDRYGHHDPDAGFMGKKSRTFMKKGATMAGKMAWKETKNTAREMDEAGRTGQMSPSLQRKVQGATMAYNFYQGMMGK